MRKYILSMMCIVVIISFGTNSFATIIGSSSPVFGFGADDGSEAFTPLTGMLGIEYYDLVPGGSYFGFYFTSDPSTPYPIFGSDDNPASVAYVDFTVGKVYDSESGAIEAVFNPGIADIGFFYTVPSESLVLYSEAYLNGGVDTVATFPGLFTDSFLIGFELPLDTAPLLLSLNYISGISSVDKAVVPEPATLMLLGFGLGGIALYMRRKK